MSSKNFFGYTIWTECFFGDKLWQESLGFPPGKDFDPENDAWNIIFDGLQGVLDDGGLTGRMGGCLHLSSRVASLTADKEGFDILPRFKEARDAFASRDAFELGIHCEFNPQVNPLGPGYHETFLNDLSSCVALGATTLVAHPPYNPSYNHAEIMEMLVEEVTSHDLADALEATDVTISWENMIEGQFSSLAELLDFKNALEDRLKEKGHGGLADRHVFCLDTGHLLLWRNKHPSTVLADKEIEKYLPEFARHVKSYHVHANDGSFDQHLAPVIDELLDHPTRKMVDRDRFRENIDRVNGWISTVEQHARLAGRHLHLEATRLPFSLKQFAAWGRYLASTNIA